MANNFEPKRPSGYAGLLAVFVLFVVFLYGPMATIFILSFQGPEGGLTFPLQGVSLHWFYKLAEGLGVVDIGAALKRSLLLGLVACGRTQEEIARELDPATPKSDPPSVAMPPAAQAAQMPAIITPMLAELGKGSPPATDEWLYEIKWDGVRAVCFLDSGKLRIVSRNGNSIAKQYPELSVLPHQVRARQAILDGEITALDAQGSTVRLMPGSSAGDGCGSASGSGRAAGYGYHKASAAAGEAIRNAGFTLDADIDGRGEGAIVDALLAIAQCIGVRKPALIQAGN